MRKSSALLGCLLLPTMALASCGSNGTGTSQGPVSSTATHRAAGSDATGAAAATSKETLSAEALQRVARLRIFFAHRSVGAHIVTDGVPAVFHDHGVTPPTVNDGMPRAGGSLGNSWLEQTDDPRAKLADFESWVRDKGVGQGADLAFMKLGYVDVNKNTDVPALFAKYRTMMAGLERDFPTVTFLHSTISLTRWSGEDNAAYERFNRLMRADYAGSGRLVDLALVLSTRPDGTRTELRTDAGETYYHLYEGYTNDGGHPNATGAKVAAAEMLHVIAGATKTGRGGAG